MKKIWIARNNFMMKPIINNNVRNKIYYFIYLLFTWTYTFKIKRHKR